MSLKIAIQMDHVSTVTIAGDTSFALALEAQRRGHQLFHYTPDSLSMRDGTVFAWAETMTVRDVAGDHFALGEPQRLDLSEVDVVLLRQDPPFDMNYITTTQFWSVSIPPPWWSTIRPGCATARKRSSSPNSPT